jgi:hypothetical protein
LEVASTCKNVTEKLSFPYLPTSARAHPVFPANKKISTMKKMLFALFAAVALFATACSKDQIRVRFQNTLDQDITAANMVFNDEHLTTVGLIPAGATTEYIDFQYFEVGSGIPMGMLKGQKGDEEISAWGGLWCATGVEFKQLAPGNYTLKIEQFGSDSLVFYQLSFVD